MSRFVHQKLDFSDITEADLRYYTHLQPLLGVIFGSKVHTQAFVDLLRNHGSPAAYVNLYFVHYLFGTKVKASNMGDLKNFELPLKGIIKKIINN